MTKSKQVSCKSNKETKNNELLNSLGPLWADSMVPLEVVLTTPINVLLYIATKASYSLSCAKDILQHLL